jgi:hypothetical protein
MSLPHLVFTTEPEVVGEGSVEGLHPVKTAATKAEKQTTADRPQTRPVGLGSAI